MIYVLWAEVGVIALEMVAAMIVLVWVLVDDSRS